MVSIYKKTIIRSWLCYMLIAHRTLEKSLSPNIQDFELNQAPHAGYFHEMATSSYKI